MVTATKSLSRFLVFAMVLGVLGASIPIATAAGALGATCNGNSNTLVITNMIKASVYVGGSRPPNPPDYPSITSENYPAVGSATVVDPILLVMGASVYVVDQNGNTVSTVCGNGPVPTVVKPTAGPATNTPIPTHQPTATPTVVGAATNTPVVQGGTTGPTNTPTSVVQPTATTGSSLQPSATPQFTATTATIVASATVQQPTSTITPTVGSAQADQLTASATQALLDQAGTATASALGLPAGPQGGANGQASTAATLMPTSSGGSLCVTTFNDVNKNGQFDGGEARLAGVAVSLTSPSGSSQQITTPADQTPCINNLTPGQYQVNARAPFGYALTTTAQVTVEVHGGTVATVTFGAIQQGAQPTPTLTNTPEGPAATPTAVATGSLLNNTPQFSCFVGIGALIVIIILIILYMVAGRRERRTD